MSFTLNIPGQNTYYCAIVFDNSIPVSQTYTPAGALFTVEPLLAINTPTLSTPGTEVQAIPYEGASVTATVTWSGGTGPFTVTFFEATDATCAVPVTPFYTTSPDPLTGVTAYSATFTFLAPNVAGPYFYCATVQDSTFNSVTNGGPGPQAPGVELDVAAYLDTSTATLTISSPGVDIGQSVPLSFTLAGVLGGNAPFTISLYANAGCTGTAIATASGLSTPAGAPLFKNIASPTTATTFCILITDGSVPPSVAKMTVGFVLSEPPGISLPDTYEIAAGTGTSITATISPTGVPDDYVRWFIGPTCTWANGITGVLDATLFPITSLTYNTGVISQTTTYSIELNDSSTGTPSSISQGICASITITVENGPVAVAVSTSPEFAGTVFVANPCSGPVFAVGCNSLTVIDSDSYTASFVLLLTDCASGTPCNVGANTLTPTALVIDNKANWVWVTGTSVLGGWLCAVDIATNTEIGCVPTGTNPDGVAIDNGLGAIYVSNYGDNTVSVYTLVGLPIGTYAVGPGPKGIAVDTVTHTVFAADFGGNTVTVMQPRGGGVYAVSTVTVGFKPFGVAINPANHNVLVTNYGSGTVTDLNGFTYGTVATFKVGGNPAGIVVDTATNTAYVTDALSGTVIPINLTTGTVGTAIPVGSAPLSIAFFLNPLAPALPSLLFVANSGSNYVTVINPATGAVIATIVVP